MEEQDGTILDDTGTVSGNDPGDTGDIPPAEEAPPENGDGTDQPPDQPEEPEKPAAGNEQNPGSDTSDPGKEDKEDAPVVMIEDGGSKEWQEDVTEQLAELMKPEDTADITERLDALIALLTPDELAEDPETDAMAIPVEGYEAFGYPVKVEYAVLFAGYEEYFIETETYDNAEIFAADYEDFVYECGRPGSSFKDFYINCIYDADGSIVYALQTPEPEPDAGEEEEPEPVDLLLSHLEDINTTLSGMVQADAAYCQMVKDYQTEMLEMQAVSTATNIIIVIGVFAIFGAMIFQQFLGRFK